MQKDSGGKLSLDMLIGLSIFLVTFIFVAQFIPTVFADVRSEVAVSNQAYRVTTLLLEHPGIWYNASTGSKGNDWETRNFCSGNIIVRPGLISISGGGSIEYNRLDTNKLESLSVMMQNCPEKFYSSLGLMDNGRMLYRVNVSLETLRSRPYSIELCQIDGKTYQLGDPIPKSATVIRLERVVYFTAGTSNGFLWDASKNEYLCKVVVSVW